MSKYRIAYVIEYRDEKNDEWSMITVDESVPPTMVFQLQKAETGEVIKEVVRPRNKGKQVRYNTILEAKHVIERLEGG